MNLTDIKKRIIKYSEKNGFTSNVILFIIFLYLAFSEGFKETTAYFSAIILLFSITGLVYLITFNIIDKKKPDSTSIKLTLLIVTLSFGLYYYEQLNLIMYSYIVGLILGIGIIIIYGIAALTDKFRK